MDADFYAEFEKRSSEKQCSQQREGEKPPQSGVSSGDNEFMAHLAVSTSLGNISNRPQTV